MALSGHILATDQGPLSGEEQTSQLKGAESAFDPKQTYSKDRPRRRISPSPLADPLGGP